MYTIKCDGYYLYHPKVGELIVNNPKFKGGTNLVGEASMDVLIEHPYYDKIYKMKSTIEIAQDEEVMFRGRVINDEKDFNNTKSLSVEGVLGYFNDSLVAPFSFPLDFDDATSSDNVVEYFLQYLIDNHNKQVEGFQKLKLGNVTVSDPNNYITRESSEYKKTWEILGDKLFNSSLGGCLCIRYEDDGNYVDYLSDYTYANTQDIKLGENILDVVQEEDGTEAFSAILPMGAMIKETKTVISVDDEGNEISTDIEIETQVDLSSIEDGYLTDDIIKKDNCLYSVNAVDNIGMIFDEPQNTSWDDVTTVEALKSKSIEYLQNSGNRWKKNIQIRALDLNLTDVDIQKLRIYRYVNVIDELHNISKQYKLDLLDVDIASPQNTIIELGDSTNSLIDNTEKKINNFGKKVENVYVDINKNSSDINEIKNSTQTNTTGIVADCEKIVFQALSDYVEIGNGSKVENISRYYIASSLDNGISSGAEGWQTELPQLDEENMYLWTFEVIKYSNDRLVVIEPHIGSTYNGIDIKDITCYYAVNSDKTKPVVVSSDSTGEEMTSEVDLEWSESIPEMTATNMYLWCYSIITYADDTQDTTEKRCIAEYSYSFAEFRELVESRLQLLATEMQLSFESSSALIKNIDGILEEIDTTLKKYFTFNQEGLSIGSVYMDENGEEQKSPFSVTIDEDELIMKYLDNINIRLASGGQSIVPNLKITDELNLFGYKIAMDDKGNVNLEYVG